MGRTFKYFTICSALLAGLFFCACQPEKNPTEIRLQVVDTSGNAVVGATVHLYGQPSDTVYVNSLSLYDREEVSGEGGWVVFNFDEHYDQGHNGFAVLTVDVVKDTLAGETLVRIAEETIVRKQVVVN